MPDSSSDIYARITSEFEHLDREGGEYRDWDRLATDVVEALMRCQSIVIEKQRAALESSRVEGPGEESARLRTEAKDALHHVDSLATLYHRIKAKIARPMR